jgi:hypothetical protein
VKIQTIFYAQTEVYCARNYCPGRSSTEPSTLIDQILADTVDCAASLQYVCGVLYYGSEKDKWPLSAIHSNWPSWLQVQNKTSRKVWTFESAFRCLELWRESLDGQVTLGHAGPANDVPASPGCHGSWTSFWHHPNSARRHWPVGIPSTQLSTH